MAPSDKNAEMDFQLTPTLTRKSFYDVRPVNNVRANPKSANHLNSYTTLLMSKKNSFKLKFKIFMFLDYPDGISSQIYHSFVFVLTTVVFLLAMFTTASSVATNTFILTYIILEIVLTSIFFLEYVLRLWTCTVNDRYSGIRIYLYIIKPYMVIDFFIVITSVILILIYLLNSHININIILFLKGFQLVRFFHFERYHSSVKLMATVLYVHRNELFTGFLSSLFLLIFASYIIYIIERNSPVKEIDSIPQSFYFAVISFLTIGYGDLVPTTSASKVFVCLLAFLGVALAAVPSGIIGSGFALQVANRSKKIKQKTIIKPATILLQRAIRSYFYKDENSLAERNDYEKVINYPKHKKIFHTRTVSMSTNFNNRSFNQRMDNLSSSPVPPPSETASLYAQGRNINEKGGFKHLIDKFKNKRNGSEYVEINPVKLKKLVTYCTSFIRHIRFMAAVKSFKRVSHPMVIEEVLQDIDANQKSLNYQFNVLKDNIRNFKYPTNDTLKETSILSSALNLDVSKRMDELQTRIEKIEDNLAKILKILTPP